MLAGCASLVWGAAAASSAEPLVVPQRPAPSTWQRTLCGSIATATPEIPAGSVEIDRDYPGNDMRLCGAVGCVMAVNATRQECAAKCYGLCVGYVFEAAACSGTGNALCWTKFQMVEGHSQPRACFTSQRVAKNASNGTDLATKWANDVSADTTPLPEYPRPQMVRTAIPRSTFRTAPTQATLRDTGDRSQWQNLNGLWEWEPLPDPSCCAPRPIPTVPTPAFGKALSKSILVPFPMESCLSGVAPTVTSTFHRSMFYRLTFSLNSSVAESTGRTLLHFGAVDWQSVFWVNGREVGNHTGGYDSIDLDITDALRAKDPAASIHELIVYVYDPSETGFQPAGKQRISANQFPSGGTYTSTSGIWQTVWLEVVPDAYIRALSLEQNSADTLAVSATAVQGAAGDGAITFRAYARGGTHVIASATAASGATALLKISAPRLWGPDDPYLYDLTATTATDVVVSYFGLRTIRVGKKESEQNKDSSATRPLLNERFTFFAGWLDQSWWPDGQYTAPTDEALASDVAAVQMFGLNMVRLHMKVNPERWYYHADRLGVVVFQDMPQKFVKPADAVPENIPAFVADLRAMIAGRKNHPSIVQFTVTNEDDCWELFNATAPYDLPKLLALVRELAPHHLIDMNSGSSGNWQLATANMSLGDVNDYHTYPAPQANRNPNATATQYAMVGEFGGAGAFVQGRLWANCFAYLILGTPLDEAQAYIQMAQTLAVWSEHLSASVYTQITDVEEECDGFLNYDRTNKFDAPTTKAIAAANQALIRAHSSQKE